MFDVCYDENIHDIIDNNESIQAYVRIIAKQMLDEKRRKHDEGGTDDELEFQNKRLPDKANTDRDLEGVSTEEQFVLEDESINKETIKEGSNGGFRNYSGTQELQDHNFPSYISISPEGVPIKTFFHAKTFNEKLTKSKRRITAGYEKPTGSVHHISLSTIDQTTSKPIKQFRSCKLIQFGRPTHISHSKKILVNDELEDDILVMSQSNLAVRKDSDENDPIEFDRESYRYQLLDRSLVQPSLGYSSKDFSIGNCIDNRMQSPYGESSYLLKKELVNKDITNQVHILPNSPSIMIGGHSRSSSLTPESVCLSKKTP